MEGLGNTIILGTVFLKKYLSVYDEGNRLIGLAKASQYVKKMSFFDK